MEESKDLNDVEHEQEDRNGDTRVCLQVSLTWTASRTGLISEQW